MPKKSFTAEEIMSKLREAEVLLSQGQALGAIYRGLDISQQTYYRSRKEYGWMRTDQARCLKELERVNARLKNLVADLSLDNVMLTLGPLQGEELHLNNALASAARDPPG